MASWEFGKIVLFIQVKIRFEGTHLDKGAKIMLCALQQMKQMVGNKRGYWDKDYQIWDFSGDPVVRNPPANAEDMGLIPGQGTKIPHAVGKLSLHTATTESKCHSWREVCVPQWRPKAAKEISKYFFKKEYQNYSYEYKLSTEETRWGLKWC